MEFLKIFVLVAMLRNPLAEAMGLENDNHTSSSAISQTDSSVLGAPQNLTSQAVSNAIAVFWEPVEGAAQYYITLSDGQDQFTGETRVAFGGLETSTLYTAVVAAVDANGTVSSNTSSIVVETLINRVQDLRVTGATETSISVEWSPIEGVSLYRYRVTDNNDQVVGGGFNDTEETFFTIDGLESNTFYFISVVPVRNGEGGSPSSIRARTDGSGVFINAEWFGSEGVFGGEIMILRPIEISETQIYRILLNFGCSLSLVRVWNANYNEEASDLFTGVVVVEQEELWQLEKSEIGLNFYYDLESINATQCQANTTIQADFGVFVPFQQQSDLRENATITLVPKVIKEWFTTPNEVARAAGLIHIQLSEEFDTPQPTIMEQANPKPARGTFVIKVNPGPECPGGVIVRYGWSMTHKSVAGIEGVDIAANYFVQEGTDWFSNSPGFVFGYNPLRCPSRSGIFIEVIIGGPLINPIFNATTIEPSY